MIPCPLCAALFEPGDMIAHDIRNHDGLTRTREDHALLCEPLGRCVCNVTEYERVAQRVLAKVTISHWTRDGREVWQVQELGGPICTETDKLNAYTVYEQRYRRGMHWDPDSRERVSDIPEMCRAIWNGDKGEWDEA